MTNKQQTKFQEKLVAGNKEKNRNFIYNLCKDYNPYRLNNSAINIYCNNFRDMVDANTQDADKYFHSKANCQAAQKGYIGGALMFDLGREGLDYLIKNPLKKMSEPANRADCIDDMKANFYGLGQGLLYPFSDCKDLINKYRPNGLNKKY